MRNLLIYLSALTALSDPVLSLSHGSAQLRDLLAYPKYDVQFLNDLPISKGDAARARSIGVKSEHDWLDLRPASEDGRHLSDGTDVPPDHRMPILPMRLVPPGSVDEAEFLCMMPSKNATDSQTARTDLDEHVDLDPVQSWAALSHLEGKCLYVKLGWFTYSYCHNQHVRQFRAAMSRFPHPPAGYEPEEDPLYDSYTLGQAYHPPPSSRRASIREKDKSNAKSLNSVSKDKSPSTDHSSSSPSISFAQGAASRYLVQRWSDGTTCDKTGRPREVEIQIHCSMTTTDVIYLIKEMAICQYVVIIHSPHLCGLPGFRAPHADVQPAPIRCRQVISEEDLEKWLNDRTERQGNKGFRLPGGMIRPTGGVDGINFAWDSLNEGTDKSQHNGEGKEVAESDVDPMERSDYLADPSNWEIDHDALRILLQEMTARGTGDTVDVDGEEYMILSLGEDQEGHVVIDTELLDRDEEGELGQKDREKLLKAISDFLNQKRQPKRREGEDGDDVGHEQSSDGAGGERDIDHVRDEL